VATKAILYGVLGGANITVFVVLVRAIRERWLH
jgi:hypothetical protein